jgi:hypothetical protein
MKGLCPKLSYEKTHVNGDEPIKRFGPFKEFKPKS